MSFVDVHNELIPYFFVLSFPLWAANNCRWTDSHSLTHSHSLSVTHSHSLTHSLSLSLTVGEGSSLVIAVVRSSVRPSVPPSAIRHPPSNTSNFDRSSVGRSFVRSVRRSVGRSVVCSVGWLVGRSVVCSVGWSVGWSVVWSVVCSVICSVVRALWSEMATGDRRPTTDDVC